MRVWHHAHAVRERLRILSPRAVLVIGYAVYVIYGFPGYMSTDSVVQLLEARRLQFTDGHPPLMAAQWALLERIVAGPVLMFFLQGALFLGGLYGLLSRVMSQRAASWAATAVFVFPPVLVTMAVIWKDAQMAAYLIAGSALMLQPRLRLRVLGLVCLAIACALRHNAFAAVLPLAFFLFEWRSGIRWWKRVAVTGVAALVMLGAALVVSRLLTDRHIQLTPVFQDIVGVIARTEPRSDEDLRHVLRDTHLVVTEGVQQHARKLHEMGGAFNIVLGENRMFDHPRTPEDYAAFHRAWKELVFGDPAAYLRAHWDTLGVMLGLGRSPEVPNPVWNLFLEDPGTMLEINHGASWSRAQYELGRAFNWLHWNTSLYAPYVYALLALALLALCARDRITIGLLTSGLLYELSFFPVGANPDYRYSHWMITSVCIATVILFAQRMRSRTS